jgi:hypothetical protein
MDQRLAVAYAVTSAVAWLMVVAGIGKKRLEWKPPRVHIGRRRPSIVPFARRRGRAQRLRR